MDEYTRWSLRPDVGAPFTLRTENTLSLHFEGLHVQSEMSLEDPYRLLLHYTQAMMAFKLFKQDPSNILIVGLGGGSLSKYCFRRFPESKIVTIENSEAVIGLRDLFKIPEDSERFQIVHADAGEYMRRVNQAYDVLLLDGFTADGLPEHLFSETFYRNCYHALADGGILVANLLGGDRHLHEQIGRIAIAFNRNCMIAYATGCDNYIVMASNGAEKLCDDVVTDVRRLIVKHRKGLNIPYFKTFADFYS